MAYADPNATHNPATDTIPPAAWGDIIRDDLEYLARNRPHSRVRNSALQSIANNTNTAITWNTEDYDVGDSHSTSSNTSRITVTTGEGGKHLWIGGGEFAGNATGDRQVALRSDGVNVLAAQRIAAANTAVKILTVPEMHTLAAASYMELVVLQDSGGALDFNTQIYSHLASMWMAL